MAKAKAPEVPETPVQSDEVRAKLLRNSSAGGDTAVGNERARLQAIEDGEEEFDGPGGSEIPIAGGEPQADAPAFEAAEPIGAQAQPSNFTTNGSLPVNQVASPSGLVPVSAVTQDATQGAKLVQENLDSHAKAVLRSGAQKLSRAKIESMTAGDLRAVAHDRGYDIQEGSGTRSTRRQFIAAQQADDDAADDEEGTDELETKPVGAPAAGAPATPGA